MDNKGRIDSAVSLLARKGLSAFVVCNLRNILYLTGFRGSSALLLLLRKKACLITDFRYREQSMGEVSGAEVVVTGTSGLKTALDLVRKRKIKRIGFERDAPYRLYERLKRGFSPVPLEGLIEELRKVKDEKETRLVREAVRRAERAFMKIRPRIRRGVTEIALARRLEDALRREGCRSLPFPSIVASGERAALPHARPSERRLRAGDLLIIDWGGEAEGYFSDMTRSFLLKGGENRGKIGIYKTVLKAQKKAIKRISTGIPARTIDEEARGVIREAGFGEYFGHGTGHGVGLDIHEAPRISWIGKETLEEGMIFTVEPGIYLPGRGGVRIEDMVQVTGKGCRLLTSLPEKLEIIQ